MQPIPWTFPFIHIPWQVIHAIDVRLAAKWDLHMVGSPHGVSYSMQTTRHGPDSKDQAVDMHSCRIRLAKLVWTAEWAAKPCDVRSEKSA